MNELIIYKAVTGSKLYGTDNENSDTDIKGVFLPDRKDLILGRAPKLYKSSTGNNRTRNDKNDVDEVYYSLHYFLELMSKGETNALDLFFSYTNKDAIITVTPAWENLFDNVDKIVSKNISSYLGYCKAQAYKYNFKGEKLNHFQALSQFCQEYQSRINLNTLRDALTIYGVEHNMERPMPINDVTRIFGNGARIETSGNKEEYLVIHNTKFALNDSITETYKKVNSVIESYGKRAKTAALNNGADYKAISHCIRILFQAEELLTTGKITFPLKEREFVKSVKYNRGVMSYDEIMDFIEQKLAYVEHILKPQSKLREKADTKFIEDFILQTYQEA